MEIDPNLLLQPQEPQKHKDITDDMRLGGRKILQQWCYAAGYNTSEIEPEQFNNLADWLTAYCINRNNPAIVDRPKRCLWLCGSCGRGKTELVKILCNKLFIPMRDADELEKGLTEDTITEYDRRLLSDPNKDLIIDDLGAETLRTNYGNQSEFPHLLQRLYKLWHDNGKLLIVTSNYGLSGDWLKALKERYGERVADRLPEMFMSVRLIGKNWRQANRAQ